MKPPRFWSAPRPTALARLLSPLGAAYGALTRARARRPGYRAGVPVICVGNAGLGGAGKTPVALDFAARLTAMGKAPHFLSRGYKGRLDGPSRVDLDRHDFRDVGDEPLLLARSAPTWIGADRAASAKAAEAAGADCLVMDDGMQNPSLHKDVTVLVIDTGVGFGNGLVLPAGPLRETPEDALDRATAVALIGDGPVDDRIARSRLPMMRARQVVALPAGLPRGARCVAFCGIARPAKFFDALRLLDLEIIEEIGFADHHGYTGRDLDRVTNLARQHDAALVTTEKDAVRLRAIAPPDVVATAHAVPLSLTWGDADAVDGLLRSAVP